MKLKKIYSTFNQAFLTSASENGAPSGWVNESEVLTEEKMKVFGKDIFIFVIDLNNQFIRPYGYNFSDSNIDYYCFGNGRLAVENNTCAEKIVRDHWQITYW